MLDEINQLKISRVPGPIAIDFDDVLFDCNDALQRIIRTEFNEESSYMEFITKYPHLKNEVFRFLYGNYHQNCAVMRGAYEVLSELVRTYRVVIITGRSESTRKQTEEWLRDNLPMLFPEVYFTNTFLAESYRERKRKPDICLKIGASVLIDDSIEEAIDAVSIGITALLFDRPWNRVNIPPTVYRVRDWHHVLHKLKGG